MRVQNLPPRLEEILNKWEVATKGIATLTGDHRRYVYDLVFKVEKRAEGSFYYKAPDQGRIDIQAVKLTKEAVPRKDEHGKPFKLEVDRPERWICDGHKIEQINDIEKTVERFPIPDQARGTNIMNGPLPFLFGMPAETAKERYQLKLLKETDAEIWLQIYPRWKQDAANWKEAKVILVKETFLPRAVQLIDPSGNLETVYTFAKLRINQPKLPAIFGIGNWLEPSLRGYKVVDNGQRVPNLIGAPWQEADKVLKGAGYTITWERAGQAPKPELALTVANQDPKPGTPQEKKAITLYVYEALQEAKR